MPIRTVIRKGLKWGGAPLAVVLVVAWIGSAWRAFASPTFGPHQFGVGRGALFWVAYPPGRPIFESFAFHPTLGPFFWWFRYEANAISYMLAIPLWPFLLLTLIVTGFAWRADLIARRRAMLGKCAKCGYARSGLPPGAVCPECGSAAAVAASDAKA